MVNYLLHCSFPKPLSFVSFGPAASNMSLLQLAKDTLVKNTLAGNMSALDMVVVVVVTIRVSSGWGYFRALERTHLRKAVQGLGMVVGEEQAQ
jgi:hypothetical protein